MAGESQIGTTAALTTQSTIVLNVRSMTPPEQPINALPVSTLATSGFREYNPGKLKEPGQQEFVILHDVDLMPTIDAGKGVADTLTITYPLKSGQITNATTVGTGFIVDYQLNEFNADDDEPQLGTLVWQWDGKTGPTHTAGA